MTEKATQEYLTIQRARYRRAKRRQRGAIIDEVDEALAQHYGFTNEELDFIVNYDIKYRMDAGAPSLWRELNGGD